MIEFSKLVISNFMSIGLKQVFPLRNQGLIRVEGKNLDEVGQDSNRAGKSAIIDALVWCLFGKTLRGVKHDAVVNRFAKRNCSVSLYFGVAGSPYRVSRYRRHEDHGNALLFWGSKTLISSRHTEETQRKIERVLGLDFLTFGNSVIFGGIRPFALLSDSQQKEILESILRFGKIDEAFHKAKAERSALEDKLGKVQERISSLKGKAAVLKERISSLRESERIFRRERKKQINRLSKRIKLLSFPEKPKLTVSHEEIEKAGGKRRDLDKRLAECSHEFQHLKRSRKKIKSRLSNTESLLGQPCPTCGQGVTPRILNRLSEHLEKDRKLLYRKLGKTKEALRSLRKEVKYAADEESRLTRKYYTQRMCLKQWRTEVCKIRSEKRVAFEERKALQTSHPPLEHKLALASTSYSRNLSRLYVAEFEKKALGSKIKDLQFWEEGFGNRGLKALVIRESLPPMNEKLQEYSQEIFGGGVELQFSPSKETKAGEERELFHISYIARRGAAQYLGESSGGRRRVDICLLLVFAWLSRASNLLLVDELLDGIDATGREAVTRILGALRGTVLLITHRRDIREGKVWTMVKKGGFSALEVSV